MKSCFYKNVSFYQIEKYLNGQAEGEELEQIEFLLHSNSSFREKLELYLVQKPNVSFAQLQARIEHRSFRSKIVQFKSFLHEKWLSCHLWAIAVMFVLLMVWFQHPAYSEQEQYWVKGSAGAKLIVNGQMVNPEDSTMFAATDSFVLHMRNSSPAYLKVFLNTPDGHDYECAAKLKDQILLYSAWTPVDLQNCPLLKGGVLQVMLTTKVVETTKVLKNQHKHQQFILWKAQYTLVPAQS
jgi:hypothetical protein